MRTTPSPLSAYQRSARSLSAKSVAPLVAAALTAASTAHAEIHVYTPATNNVVGNPGTVFIDFFTGGIGAIGSVPHGQFVLNVDNDGYYDSLRSKIYAFSRGAAINSYIHLHGYADQSDDIAANFAPGTPLGADSFTGSADFNGRTSLAGAAPAWSNATGYVGVKFLAADFNGSDAVYNYGWIKLQTNVDASQLTVLAFGYNDVDGGAISAGQGPTPVPEPATSAALLALGAAGLVAYRQRKQLRRA